MATFILYKLFWMIYISVHISKSEVLWYYAMNSTIPIGQWLGVSALVTDTTNDPQCPQSTTYCWQGYSSNQNKDWSITRISQITFNYINIVFTYQLSTSLPVPDTFCIIDYSTDGGANWADIERINGQNVDISGSFTAWSPTDPNTIQIRVQSIDDSGVNGVRYCWFNEFKLTAEPPTASPTSAARTTETPTTTPITISPTTSNPTTAPTESPTVLTDNPTVSPTPVIPTTSAPSLSPSKYPTRTPTANPTISPTEIPTEEPTRSPSPPPSKYGQTMPPSVDLAAKGTAYQTNDTTLSHSQEMEDILHLQQERRNSLEIIFQYFIYIILGFVLLIALSGYFHSRFLSVNDFFQVKYVMVAGIQMFDTLSDCCFAINLSTHIDNERNINTQFRLPLILSVASIIIPICISIVQLFLYSHKHWYADGRVTGWLAVNTKYLYTLSFLTGSSFTAVSLFNSELFGLGLFCMGLSERDVLTFSIKRVYSVIAAENLPQTVIQTWYIFIVYNHNEEGTNSNYIAITSLIFSFMSIIVAFLSFVGQKRIIDAQSYIEIKMDVIGKFNRQRCKGIVEGLKTYFCFDVFVVDKNLIEVLKPLFIKKGLQLTIRIYFDDKNDGKNDTYHALINDVRSNGELAQQIKHCWNIQSVPNIENIKVQTIESKNIRHNARDAYDYVHLQMIPPQI